MLQFSFNRHDFYNGPAVFVLENPKNQQNIPEAGIASERSGAVFGQDIFYFFLKKRLFTW